MDVNPPMYGAPYSQSRLSLAPSEMLGGGMLPSGRSVADMEMADLTGLPTDDMILNEIRDILKTADLMTVTKKGIKQELERRFNVNLDAKRAYIGSGKLAPSSLLCTMLILPSYRSYFVWPAVRYSCCIDSVMFGV
jgi:hypothetical protein